MIIDSNTCAVKTLKSSRILHLIVFFTNKPTSTSIVIISTARYDTVISGSVRREPFSVRNNSLRLMYSKRLVYCISIVLDTFTQGGNTYMRTHKTQTYLNAHTHTCSRIHAAHVLIHARENTRIYTQI